MKAIDRAHRWQGMLESGAFATVEELARAERINSSYLARVLRHSLAWLHGLGAFSVVGSVS